jgi:hypothetical protein
VKSDSLCPFPEGPEGMPWADAFGIRPFLDKQKGPWKGSLKIMSWIKL